MITYLPARPLTRRNVRGSGVAGQMSENPAVGEGPKDGVRGGGTVKLLCGSDGPLRQVRHVGAGKVERPLQDDRVGLDVAECLADIPQRPRPDLAVVVYLAVEIGRVVQVGVNASQA